jgi:CheY-like chemotaxis protein
LLQAIRAEGTNHDTPVIVVTVVPDQSVAAGFQVADILAKPVAPQDLVESLQRAKVQPSLAAPVLIVDDDEVASKLASSALQQAGYRAARASGCEEAMRLVETTPPAAIVLDLLMPGADGFEFLRRFREATGGLRTPVIVWTVKDLTHQERERLQATAQSVVLKGDGTAALLAELHAFVPLPRLAQRTREVLHAG